MSLEDDDANTAFRASVRRMAETRIAPHAARVDDAAEFPVDSLKAFQALELCGLPFPAELSGSGGDLMAQVIAVEAVARVCASSAIILLIPWASLAPLVKHGSESLKKAIVPDVASGRSLASFCLTEPGGGSDLPGLKTRAERVAGGWLLNGQKRFISNAGYSDWYAVLARTGEKAFGVFLVHKSDHGFSIGHYERKMGTRGSPTADVHLDDLVIPEDRVIGDPSQGYAYMMDTLTYTRPLVGAHALGIAQGALDEAVRYTAERTQFQSKLNKFQLVRAMIADMATKIEAARSLLYRSVAIAESNDDRARAFVAMAKITCSNAAMEVTTDAVQLHGGYGYMKDYPVERMMRDAKVTQIWEGTNQIQQMLVAKYIYGGR